MIQSITKKSLFVGIFSTFFFSSCAQPVVNSEPSKEEKVVYVQSLKERILKAETAMIRLRFDRDKLNSRFARLSKAEYMERLVQLDKEIDDLLKEITYLRGLNLDDLYEYP